VRASLNQRLENAFQNCFRLLQHFIVPEPNHAETKARQIARAFKFLQQMLVVLTPVYFNDQSRSQTDEIRDVRS